MPHFCKLEDPHGYEACDWDLLADPVGREAWIDIFAEHTASLLEHARVSDHAPAENALGAYETAFLGLLDGVRESPADFAPLTIYKLCQLRAEMMREYDLGDPYDRVKREENSAALGHLPAVLAGLDHCPDDRVVETLLRGILAGNRFDLGAKETVEEHAREGINFFKTLEELAPRPWFVDDGDEIARRWGRSGRPYHKAIFFVDNAGGDVVLGAIPLARYLADQGCRVVLAANDQPSLNDIVLHELNDVLTAATGVDSCLAGHLRASRISTVGTGCDCPLIDLGAVTEECNAAAEDCDLVILEGMGRAVETNYHARFTCDAIHLAMIKNRKLAAYLGCKIFDLIVRFTPAGT